MSNKISRRNFLHTAGLGTLGAAAAGLLTACGDKAASGSVASSAAAGTYTAGTYSATATGINTTTPVTVTMTFSADAITDVQIDVANETKGYGADIADEMVKKILDAQSSEVDGHSGATITSDAIKKAAESCINQAKGRGRGSHRGQQGRDRCARRTDHRGSGVLCGGSWATSPPTRLRTLTWSLWVPVLPVCPPQAGLPSWAAMWLCCRSRASWSARATAVPPSSSPSPPRPARRCGCT